MGKKGKKNRAKTGDRALYRAREAQQQHATHARRNGDNDDDDDDNPMYDRVDRYHNRREEEYLKLDTVESDDDNDDDDDDGISRREAVMDLAAGASSDEDSEDDDDGDDDDLRAAGDDDDDDIEEEEEEDLSLDVNDDLEEELEAVKHGDVRNWGRRKALYYQGDTADAGNVDDALLEEEAAQQVIAARLKEMSEDDFLLSDTEDVVKESKKKKPTESSSSTTSNVLQSSRTKREWSKLTKQEQHKFLQTRHPEFLPLTLYFGDVVQDWNDKTRVATKALLESNEAEAVGATTNGQLYLVTKAMLQASMALNVTMYLLLKAEQATTKSNNKGSNFMENNNDSTLIQSHPVMERLRQLNLLAQRLEDQVESKVPTLLDQVDHLTQAAKLMATGQVSDDDDDDDDNDNDSHDDKDEVSNDHGNKVNDSSSSPSSSNKSNLSEDDAAVSDHDSADSSSVQRNTTLKKRMEEAEDDDDSDYGAHAARAVLNEARFGLRSREMMEDDKNNNKNNSKKKKMKKTSSKQESNNKSRRLLDQHADHDFGDDDQVDEQTNNHAPSKRATQYLAATINTIEQRTLQSTKRRPAPLSSSDRVDDDEDAKLRRGLDMMEADLGGAFSNDDDDVDDYNNNERNAMGKRKHDDNDNDDFSDDDSFYRQVKKKSKAKKEMKKDKYKVAPKYPRLEEEIQGERAIGKTILKNRGLVAHKAKINRNPRVKKREQYRKALIRRRGAVRDVRTNEAHDYGGEQTGIKVNLSRSRKIGVSK